MVYGDDAGMEGYADPYNRGPYPWGRRNVCRDLTRLALLGRSPCPAQDSGSRWLRVYGVSPAEVCNARVGQPGKRAGFLPLRGGGGGVLARLPDAEGHIRLPPRAVILCLRKKRMPSCGITQESPHPLDKTAAYVIILKFDRRLFMVLITLMYHAPSANICLSQLNKRGNDPANVDLLMPMVKYRGAGGMSLSA